MKLAQKRGKIYKIDGDELHLIRTGTHSDLF
jgi:mRNA-degrading endonuclease YafQ of YafQ-DinJ toxin-antitoxin module